MTEDCVTYFLYPVLDHDLCPHSTLAKVHTLLAPLTRGWVWHNQPFTLSVIQSSDSWHLSGSVNFGENVLDEWFVVSLIQFLTREIPTLVGRLTDTDGEFLLIEAADVLPSWAGEPSVAEGRVYLSSGEMYLIPVADSPSLVTPIPGVTPPPHVCAQVVVNYPTLCRAGDKVQTAVKERLSGLSDNHHSTNVLLPSLVVELLSRHPEQLSKLVRAVMERDQLDLRKCRGMEKVKQIGTVECRVTFSKCLYAMLTGCKVQPYKSSDWSIGQSKAECIGFKLALGLEILLSRSKNSSSSSFGGDKDFSKFLLKLQEVGFFQNELEGSEKYKTLFEESRKFWNSSSNQEFEEDLCKTVDQLNITYNKSSPPVDSFVIGPKIKVSDNEDWMEMTPESLDRMLEIQFGVSASSSGGQDIPEEVNKFLGQMSDMTGVEHDDDKVSFDPDKMLDSITKMMGNIGGGEEISDTDESDADDDPVMRDYMCRLDDEVGGQVKGRDEMPDIDKPLDIDTKLLESLMKSYSAQSEMGGHGPTSSLLQSIRVNPGRPK